jgi:precorrin-6B methylase 1
MTTVKKLSAPQSNDVRPEAITAIVERLGIGSAALFIRENLSQPTDYLTIKDQLFGTLNAADIYREIEAECSFVRRQ